MKRDKSGVRAPHGPRSGFRLSDLVPTTGAEGSGLSVRKRMPPSAPPSSGASQNSQSWPIAQAPANSAGPVLRAGLTEVLVTGIEMRWISVNPRPMAIGAKPTGAREWVEPMMMNRNIIVSTSSVEEAGGEAVMAGRMVAVAVGRETLGGVEAGRAAGDEIEHHRRRRWRR